MSDTEKNKGHDPKKNKYCNRAKKQRYKKKRKNDNTKNRILVVNVMT